MTSSARFRDRMRLLVAATSALVLVGISLPASASAFWSVTAAVPGAGSARAATVNQGGTPTTTVAAPNTVSVSWPASTLSNGVAVTGYTVTRYSSTNVATAATGGCAGTLATLGCSEVSVPDGLWTYTITPRLANWIGPESARSAGARVDTAPPLNAVTRAVVSGRSFLTGTTLYYRGGVAGSLTLVNAVSDPEGSGPASSTTSALQGVSTGFTHTPSTVTTPAGGPFVSNAVSWTAAATSGPSIVVTGSDVAGNQQATTLAFVRDITAPAGGAITHTDGTVRSTTLVVGIAAVTDAGSDVASRLLQRRTAVLTDDTCPGFSGAWTTVATNPTGTSYTDTVTVDRCIQYQYVLTDNVGNVSTVGSGSVTKVKATYQTGIQATPGILNYWRLGETTGTAFADSTGTNTGTHVNGVALGQPGVIVGQNNTAVAYDGVNDYSTVTNSLSGSFSIEFWFKSDGGGVGTGSTGQWWDAAGLVDGEISGAANDFGVSLTAEGRIRAGVGNPDITTTSQAGLNNNAWHHVVMTRNQATGVVTLYVDGIQAGTPVTGNRLALTAPTTLRFGSIRTGFNYYRGALDEVAFYNQVLTPAQVSAHYYSAL